MYIFVFNHCLLYESIHLKTDFAGSLEFLRLGSLLLAVFRSLGVVSGMTASGGAVGAIITNRLFFSGSRYTVEEAISLTGAASLVCTLPLALVHFPRHGGMLCGPTATGGDEDGDTDTDDNKNANDHGDYYTLLK
jgi:NNP family nitrate/nitrite transporter-like MFS transporter